MPLDALAPDQRAVVQLVLQRERSYAQIAELLKISEDAVRARAHAGLSALAPEVELPADRLAQISDFLLGQQNGKPRQATRRLLRSSNGAREWAETVRAQLEDVGGNLPELPPLAAERAPRKAASTEGAAPEAATADAATEEATPTPDEVAPVAADAAPDEADAAPGDTSSAAAAAAAPAPDRPAPRPRPLRGQAAAGDGADVPLPSASGAVAAGSSRIGGAVLIGIVLLALVGLVLWLFVFKSSDDNSSNASNTSAKASATPAPTPRQVGEIALKGVNGSKATGVMRLYTAQNQLAFTLAGTGVPANKRNQAYAVWFVNPGSQRLGFAQPVTSNGQLGTTGPRTEDLNKFPQWLAKYKQVVVSRETSGNAKQPGPLILRGTLPRGSG
jgi:Sigma-70, region 4